MHGPARYLAPCVAALLLGSTTGLAAAENGAEGELSTLQAAERSAVLELYAVEAALARARAEVERNARRARSLSTARDRALVHTAVVRRSLVVTQARIAELLRRLYVVGAPEPLAVLLGARSLPAVLEGLDGLERATRRNRELAGEARRRASELRAELARLERARAELAEARRSSEALAAGLEAAASAKRSKLASLRRKESLTRARVAALEAQAVAAERTSRRLAPAMPAIASSPPPAPASAEEVPVAATTSAPTGRRTLVVDAVAYHLPGHTASGLPVGVGVIAVDPSVIPLGTRVFVPGYGPAVAADVGSAIKGDVIDLWMPSTAAARAWGRRTVTITVYG